MGIFVYSLFLIIFILLCAVIGLFISIIKIAHLTRDKVTDQDELITKLTSKSFPYRKNSFTFHPSEKEFFHALEQIDIIKNNYYIFPQLSLSKILIVPEDIHDHWLYLSQIIYKTVDFALFDKKTLTPVLVIELDGKSHEDPNRIERDEFVNEALNSAGIKIYHQIRQDGGYNVQELSSKLTTLFK